MSKSNGEQGKLRRTAVCMKVCTDGGVMDEDD